MKISPCTYGGERGGGKSERERDQLMKHHPAIVIEVFANTIFKYLCDITGSGIPTHALCSHGW